MVGHNDLHDIQRLYPLHGPGRCLILHRIRVPPEGEKIITSPCKDSPIVRQGRRMLQPRRNLHYPYCVDTEKWVEDRRLCAACAVGVFGCPAAET